MKGQNVILYAIVIFSSWLWGMTFLGSKIALTELTPIEVLAGRWSISMAAFLLMRAAGVIRVHYFGKPVWKLLLVALAQPCINCLCETAGVDLTTATEASVMYAMIPVSVAALSAVFLKEKLNRDTVIGIVLAVIGAVTALFGTNGFTITASVKGYSVLLAMVLSGGIFTLSSRWASKDFTSLEIVFVQAFAGMLWFNALAYMEDGCVDWLRVSISIPEIGLTELFLGLIGSCFCYIIFQYAVSKISAVKASMLQVNVLCLSGIISGIVFLGDPWNAATVLGTVLVLVGVIFTNRRKPEF